VLLGDRARAADLYDRLLPYADLVFVHDQLRSVSGTVASALGSLATLLGRYDDGERHYQRAHALEAAMGGITAVMDRAGYARLLLVRGQSGDRQRGIALLDDVRQNMACLGIRSNWQLVAIDELGLLASPSPPPGRSRGRPITTKPSRNRQDSGDG